MTEEPEGDQADPCEGCAQSREGNMGREIQTYGNKGIAGGPKHHNRQKAYRGIDAHCLSSQATFTRRDLARVSDRILAYRRGLDINQCRSCVDFLHDGHSKPFGKVTLSNVAGEHMPTQKGSAVCDVEPEALDCLAAYADLCNLRTR